MTIEAELADGRVLEFPDGTHPDVIRATVKKQMEPPPKSGLQQADEFMKRAYSMTPGGFLANRGKQALEGLDHVAYKTGEFVSDQMTKAGHSPETSAAVGTAANLGLQALPMLAGGEAAKMASPVLRSKAEELMQSAMKPKYGDLDKGNAAKAIDTMLEEGINVSKGGVAQLRTKINELNEQIFDAIKNSPATVDKNQVASALLIPLKKFEMQVNPGADVQAIEKAWTAFLEHPLLAGMKDIPVELAQKLKQGTYRALGDKSYGELKGAETEAQKHLARGLKEGIADAVPEVAGLNAQESKLINALNIVERRVLMDANKNPAGLSLLAKNPEAWAAFMADRSPMFKSLAARLLNHEAEALPASAGRVVGAAAGAYAGQPSK